MMSLPASKRARLQQSDEPLLVFTNEATSFRFLPPNSNNQSQSQLLSSSLPAFHPLFTYPFYGEEEQLPLERGEEFKVWIDPVSLRAWCPANTSPMLLAPVKERWTDLQVGGEFRPTLQDGKWWEEAELVARQDHYAVFKCSLGKSEAFRLLHRRLQIMLLYYIEGASFIDEDDDRWVIYVVAAEAVGRSVDGGGQEIGPEKRDAGEEMYSVCGYATLYPFLYWPEGVRLRLAQFLILPHQQGRGLGALLYRSLYQQAILQDPTVHELTVEDPNDEFSGLRLAMDVKLVQPFINGLESALLQWCKRGEGRAQFEIIRRKLKLAPSAFIDALLALGLPLLAGEEDAREYERGVKAVYRARLADRLEKDRAREQLDDLYQDWLLRAQRALKQPS